MIASIKKYTQDIPQKIFLKNKSIRNIEFIKFARYLYTFHKNHISFEKITYLRIFRIIYL